METTQGLVIHGILFPKSAKRVSYYGNWARFRPGDGACKIEHIAPKLCTHLMYAFIGFDSRGNILCTDNEIELLPDIVLLKRTNPSLKVLVSIGGWSLGSELFSNVVGDNELRKTFIKTTINFLNRFNLDGVDLDWEYPCQRGGSSVDKKNFATLLKEFRENAEFKSKGYLLTAAVGATKDKIEKSYDVPALNQYLDFINVMSYDYNGPWEGTTKTGHNAPIQSVKSSISSWLNAGLQSNKLILGVPAYGRVFQLASRNNTMVGAPFVGPGNKGPYTNEAATIGYNEVCEYLDDKAWIKEFDQHAQVPYMHKGDQWISYDNPRSIRHKVEAAKERSLGGIMLWSCDTDNFRGKSGDRHEIQQAIADAMKETTQTIKVQTSDKTNSPPAASCWCF